MIREIEATVQLWVKQLSKPIQDNGDWLQSALASLLKKQSGIPTEEQLKAFAGSLSASLLAKCTGNWDVENPQSKSMWRVLSVDYDPCEELYNACLASGISAFLLPIKSTTWTNPGKVSHRFGYGAPLQEIIIEAQPF